MPALTILARLSELVYLPDGGQSVLAAENSAWSVYRDSGTLGIGPATGYFGAAYINRGTQEIVFAHRGMQLSEGQDIVAVLQANAGRAPDQFPDAMRFYDQVVDIAIDERIGGFVRFQTGHSLGGGIANLLGARTGERTVGFNSIGVRGVLQELHLNPSLPYSNILNISAHFDPAKIFVGARIGRTHDVTVSSLPRVLGFLEPILAGAALVKLGPVGKLLFGLFMRSQHRIENLAGTIHALPRDYFLLPQPAAPVSLMPDGSVSGAWARELLDFENALDSSQELRTALSDPAYFAHEIVSRSEIEAEQRAEELTGRRYVGNDAPNLIVGSDAADTLKGGAGADIMFGDEGADWLEGGTGDDFLIGGAGADTYVFSTGDGQDRIVDEGQNYLVRDGRLIAGLFVRDAQSGTYRWIGDRGVTLTFGASAMISFGGGDSVTLANQTDASSFTQGDFGIRLLGSPSDPAPTTNIYGDLEPIDFNPPYRDYRNDALGNLRVYPDVPAPDRADTFRDSTGSDLIDAGGGNDLIIATRGGGDRLLGGAGRDIIQAGAGDDLLEGGTGDDIIQGGLGDDRIYGRDRIAQEAAIAAGESAGTVGGTSELLSGDEGDDIVVGSNTSDLLLGGQGQEVIVGGGGDDTIFGDGTVSGATLDWTLTRTVAGSGGNNSFNVVILSAAFSTSLSEGAADAIYGGAGDDWIFAGAGDDYAEGGAGDDVLLGEAGSDILIGGFGKDVLFENKGGEVLRRAETVRRKRGLSKEKHLNGSGRIKRATNCVPALRKRGAQRIDRCHPCVTGA